MLYYQEALVKYPLLAPIRPQTVSALSGARSCAALVPLPPPALREQREQDRAPATAPPRRRESEGVTTTKRAAETSIGNYVDGFYNIEGLHSISTTSVRSNSS